MQHNENKRFLRNTKIKNFKNKSKKVNNLTRLIKIKRSLLTIVKRS